MLRIKVTWNAPQGAPYYTTFYFGGDTAGEADAAAAAVADFLGVVDGNIATTYSWTIDTEAEFVDPVTGNITGVETVAGPTGTGGGSGDPLPFTSQALVRWRTGQFVNGREIRGRTFFPGFVETSSTGGGVTASLIPGMNTAATNFVTASSGGGGLVVYSPTHGLAAQVTVASTWNQFAVLRSRRD